MKPDLYILLKGMNLNSFSCGLNTTITVLLQVGFGIKKTTKVDILLNKETKATQPIKD